MLGDILGNLLANLIWAVIFVPIAGLLLRVKAIQIMLARLAPTLGGKVPHISFALEYVAAATKVSNIVIENAGLEPAYNVYVYLFEKHQGEASFSIKSLGNEGIKKGILGAGKSIVFKDRQVVFENCNVTSEQEVWVEFSNAAGVHFRSIVLPQTARGDDWRVLPPRVIKFRLPMLPGWKYESQSRKDLKKIRKGRKQVSS